MAGEEELPVGIIQTDISSLQSENLIDYWQKSFLAIKGESDRYKACCRILRIQYDEVHQQNTYLQWLILKQQEHIKSLELGQQQMLDHVSPLPTQGVYASQSSQTGPPSPSIARLQPTLHQEAVLHNIAPLSNRGDLLVLNSEKRKAEVDQARQSATKTRRLRNGDKRG